MTKMDRRAVLRGLGGLLVALPVLEGCSRMDDVPSAPAREPKVGTRRDALVGTPAKRFVALMCPNGVDPSLWFPTGSETSFTLNQQNAPLEPIKAHLVLTQGILNKLAIDTPNGNGHAEGVQSLLTGFSPRDVGGNDWRLSQGPSIDQIIAEHHAKAGFVGRVRGIHLGEEAPGTYSAISIKPSGDREDYTWDMRALFDSPGAESAAALERARLRNKSVLDGTRADYTKLAARVSGEDKRRIDAHLEALRSIEVRFNQVTACANPNLPEAANDDQRRDLIYDIITAAMTCDATRVATVVFRHSGGGGPTLPFINVFEDIHELSHQIVGAPAGAKARNDFTAYHRWWSQKTLRFIQKMKDTPMPGGGSLFDDVVFFQGSEIGHDHHCRDMPFLLAAGAKTPLRTGRFVRFSPGAMHTHLLTTLLHAFGIDAAQVGDPRYAPGNLDKELLRA